MLHFSFIFFKIKFQFEELSYYFHENNFITVRISPNKSCMGNCIGQILNSNLNSGFPAIYQIVRQKLID